MNQNDFIEFGKVLARYLPQVATWLAQLAKDQDAADPGQGTIRSVWADLLGDCTVDECREVLKRIARQEIAIPGWQDIPGIIRREAVNARPKPPNPYLDHGQKWEISGELGEAYSEIRQCDKDPVKIGQVIDKWIHKWSQDESREPRYRCWDCMDVGMVICWHVHCLRMHKRGKEFKPMTMAVKCNCDASAKFGDGKNPTEPAPRYNEYKHCRYQTGNISEVTNWFDWRKSKGISHNPNYNSDLAMP